MIDVAKNFPSAPRIPTSCKIVSKLLVQNIERIQYIGVNMLKTSK